MEGRTDAWIGLVELTGRRGNHILGLDEAGGFAIVLAHAKDAIEYQNRVRECAAVLGLEVIAFNEIEQLALRLTKTHVDSSVQDLALQLSATSPVLFDILHTYPYSDENMMNE
jgi:hypothetical protein